MKHTLLSIAITVGSFAIPFVTMNAQAMDDAYQIPFDFNAEGHQFAAGRYVVPNTAGSFGSLRSERGNGVQYLAGTLSAKPRRAHMTFEKVGDRYFLRQIWNDNGIGSKVPLGAQEREAISRQEVAKGTNPEVTVLAKR